MIAKRTLTLLVPLVLWGCLAAPPPHKRALEASDLCARYINEGDLVSAEVQCDLGLQFSPTFADLWVNKGLIAVKREQYDRGKEFFIKALRYNNEQAQAYNNLGHVYLTQEKAYGKAHDNFQRALKVNPDYTAARYNLGITFMAMKEWEKAKKELRTLIAVNPNLSEPYAQLGQIFIEEKKFEDAVTQLKKAVELDAAYSDAYLALGNAYMELGLFTEAAEAYTSCIEAKGNQAQCRNNLAIANRKKGLADPGFKEKERVQGDEKTAAGQYALALNAKQLGLRDKEERAYKKCTKLDPKFAPCHFGLFEIYVDDRRDRDAQRECKDFTRHADAQEFPKEYERCEKYLAKFNE